MTSPFRVLTDLPRLLGHPRASRQTILDFQERRLRQLVRHAYENVPYYRRLFDEAGLKPGDIRGLADLHRIPVTTKATLQALGGSEMLTRGLEPAKLITRETNGSTGVPLTVRRQRMEQLVPVFFLWRVRRELGLTPSLRVTFLTKFGPGAGSRSFLSRGRKRLQRLAGLRAWTRVSSTAPIDEVATRVRESNPDVIGGYAGVLNRLAGYLGEQQTELRPRLILSVAEQLTPTMRTRIEKVFHAPVRDTYACYELGMIAYECPKGGTYHVCDDNVIVEVLKDGGSSVIEPGDAGELVGTSLHFAAMPMIRYQLGDIVTNGPPQCTCGSPFSTLSAIQGRMNDYFPLPNGRVLHPYLIGTAVWRASFEWMHQYQVIQERRDKVVMRIVQSRAPTGDELTTLERAIHDVLGPGVAVALEFVDDIAEEANGKFRIYRSYVESDYDPQTGRRIQKIEKSTDSQASETKGEKSDSAD
jgi:phenylacetate-CoA ligase